jgi:uncharacterized protein (DUF2345 family)
MAENTRRPENQGPKLDKGIYMAKIVGHLDPSYMGSLEVTLLRADGNDPGDSTQTYVVKYANPFYGVTGYDYMGNNTQAKNGTQAGFDDTQKSYGMSFVPPDVGSTVLVMFVEGNPAEGFWIACVMDRFANHMIPAIGSSDKVDISAEDKTKYDYKPGQFLPVAEINRLNNDNSTGSDIDKIKKSVHPIANKFLEQGLLTDDIRGTSNSTMRRDIPSMVFGISTPGPKDRSEGAKRVSVGKKQTRSTSAVPISRLGGTTFVMDDGDDQFQRKKPASTGGPEYADLLAGEKGTPNIPYGEHFRIRTRTGHQILFHNAEDLIYIGNARGTAWIELTSNGKIDIFAEDSISIHTKNDFNFKAGRDINIEAGRNINIKTTAEYQDPENLYEENGLFDAANFEKGRIQIESAENFNLLIGRNGKIHVRNDEQIQGNLDVKVMGNMRLSVQDKDEEPSVTNVVEEKIIEEQPEQVKGLHIYSFENTRITTVKNLDLNSGGNNAYTAGGTTDIKSGGNHTETAAQIQMNGPAAKAAAEAEIADKILKLSIHENPLTSVEAGWKKKYQDGVIESIIKRVPMHEPWILHENLAPDLLTPDNTDREA